MKTNKGIRTFFSSFWLWFIVALIINQMALFFVFLTMILKPAADRLSQVIGMAVEATVLIDQQNPQRGLIEFQTAIAGFPDITISINDDPFVEIPGYYVGMQAVRQSLESRSGQKLHIGYAPPPRQALIIKALDHPGLTLRLSFKGNQATLQYLGMSLLLTLVVGAGGAFWISRRLTKPLQQLSDAAIRLGGDKDFRRMETPPGSSPELAQLAETLNRMRATLDASATERENLLASVAHDLRTPLSRMRLAIELEGNRNQALTEGLREDVIEMGAVMEQFIELSRLNLEADEAWISGDINTLILNLQDKYRRAGIELSVALGEHLPDLRHKPLALTRLLYNLIDNAYRHGNGDVMIQTQHVDNQVLLTVSNPVSAEEEETGLMRALRDQSSGKTAGLGLSIVRRFAEVHGASLQESTAKGIRKYVLTFQLPS